MLSLLLVEVLGGADSKAFWITSGTCIPGASARPLPEKILIVSIPDREISAEPLGGLGVVGREGIGVTDLEMTPFSLVSLPFFGASFEENMVGEGGWVMVQGKDEKERRRTSDENGCEHYRSVTDESDDFPLRIFRSIQAPDSAPIPSFSSTSRSMRSDRCPKSE